jgi:hypothetical protein
MTDQNYHKKYLDKLKKIPSPKFKFDEGIKIIKIKNYSESDLSFSTFSAIRGAAFLTNFSSHWCCSQRV